MIKIKEKDVSKDTILFSEEADDIRKAADILKKGGLVGFPTETVYGLGANALSKESVKGIYEAKGRPSDNPMIVHIATKEDVNKIAVNISLKAKALMEEFWPGPLTVILHRHKSVPLETTGGLETVAVRMPSNKTALELIKLSTFPIAAPSANLSGRPSPTKAEHVIQDLSGKIDGIVVGGWCDVGIESTVIDTTCEPPMILRPGVITGEEIAQRLRFEVDIDQSLLQRDTNDEYIKPKSPGQKYKHYAPKASMTIYSGESDNVIRAINKDKETYESEGKSVGVLYYAAGEETRALHEFFHQLRTFDNEGKDIILAAAMKQEGLGFSLMNRMIKSAGYNIKEV